MALRDNLLFYYKLDGNANDSTTNNNDGTATNVSYVSGKIGDCGELGTNKIISVPDTQLSTSYDIGFRINPTSNTSGIPIASVTDTSSSLGYTDINFICLLSEGKFVWQTTKYSPNTDNSVSSVSDINTNEWTYIILSYNDTTKTGSIYINNVLDNSAVWSNGINIYEKPIFFGQLNSQKLGYPYSGLLDEISFWDGNLSSDYRTELYNDGDGLTYPIINPNNTASFFSFFN